MVRVDQVHRTHAMLLLLQAMQDGAHGAVVRVQLDLSGHVE